MTYVLLVHPTVRRWTFSVLSLSTAGALLVLLLAFLEWPAALVNAAAGSDLPMVRYVVPSGDCGAVTPCYNNVQAALDAALPGDEVRLAAGIYGDLQAREGITQVVYLTKTLTLRGGFTSRNWQRAEPEVNRSVLDAHTQGRVIVISGTIAPLVEGLWIIGGNATGLGGHEIADAIFGYDLPSGDAGGGIYIASATPTISNCVIDSNMASTANDGLGGGVYARQSLTGYIWLIGNQITRNSAGTGQNSSGGGVLTVESNVALDRNTVTSNAQEGIFLVRGQVTVTGNIIQANRTHGVQLRASSGTVSGNWLLRNADSGLLAEAILVIEEPNAPSIDLINNVAAVNGGDGIALTGRYDSRFGPRYINARLLHNTIADNQGVGLHVLGAGVSATNNIISGQAIGVSVAGLLPSSDLVRMQHTLWYPTYAVVDANPPNWPPLVSTTVDITGTPDFVRPALLNYHLASASAAIGEAMATDVVTDIDGEVRPLDGNADLGADEYTPIYGIVRIVYLPILILER